MIKKNANVENWLKKHKNVEWSRGVVQSNTLWLVLLRTEEKFLRDSCEGVCKENK